MKDKDKKKEEHLKEIAELRRQNARLKALEIERKRTKEALRESESHRDITKRNQSEGFIQSSKAELRRLSSRLLSVQEDERRKIARELHDGLGQTLSAIKFLLRKHPSKTNLYRQLIPHPVLGNCHPHDSKCH